MTIPTHETQFGLLCVDGVDAAKFLQGQLTCNINEVTESNPKLAAHCNPQGRIISLFDVFLRDNKYYLLMPLSMISIATRALKKYAVFFKTTLTDASTDNYINEIMTTHKSRIEAGIPTIYPETSEKFLPHEINLQCLNGISFNKGCYTGQEIIARMHYRGHLKKHMYKFHVGSTSIPTPGADVYDANEPCGNIVDSDQGDENHFQILIILNEATLNSPTLFLTLENKEPLHLQQLPYSF